MLSPDFPVTDFDQGAGGNTGALFFPQPYHCIKSTGRGLTGYRIKVRFTIEAPAPNALEIPFRRIQQVKVMSISGLGGSPFAGMRGAFQPPSFASIDTNSDKSITLDELKARAPGGANAASDKRAGALFKAMDADGNGSVTEDEKSAFDQKVQDRQAGLAFLAQQLSIPSNDDVFAATDTDGDGSVSLEEFSADDAAKSASSDALQKLFDLIDADGDGAISKTESSDFLDSVKAAVADRGPPPPGGVGGPPPPPPSDEGNSSSTDLLSLAQSAYSSTNKSADLIKMLQSLLETSA